MIALPRDLGRGAAFFWAFVYILLLYPPAELALLQYQYWHLQFQADRLFS